MPTHTNQVLDVSGVTRADYDACIDAGLEVDSLRYRYAPMSDAPYFARLAAAPCPNARRLTEAAVACRLEAFAGHLPKE